MFRREVFLGLGGYDARYFLYLEDIDLAFRARSRGHRSYVVPGATVEHDLGGSGTASAAQRWVARNQLWCWVAHAPDLSARSLARTTAREWREARRRGLGRAYAGGRAAALLDLPRLLAQRRGERLARLVPDAVLAAACDLGPELTPAAPATRPAPAAGG